jgi:hypothetical protein
MWELDPKYQNAQDETVKLKWRYFYEKIKLVV